MVKVNPGDGSIYASVAYIQKRKGILIVDETGLRFREDGGNKTIDIAFSKISDLQVTGLLGHRISITSGGSRYIIKVPELDRWFRMIQLGVMVTRKLTKPDGSSGERRVERSKNSHTAAQQSGTTPSPNPLVEQIRKRKSMSAPAPAAPTQTAQKLEPIVEKPEYKGSWPTGQDYEQSFQSPAGYVHPSLGNVSVWNVIRNTRNPSWLVQASGNYGSVYRIDDGSGKTFAIKCFTRKSIQLNARYQIIHQYLQSQAGKKLPLVDFSYYPDGIRTRRDPSYYFPLVKMPWIEGQTLNKYISANISRPKSFETLAIKFAGVMSSLQAVGISHGDLSGDNIIVDSTGNILLVDYDGMFVPPLSQEKATENGHADFQHPARGRDNFSRYTDNFSILVVFLSLLVLARRPEMWEKYNGDDPDCLILRKKDFMDPTGSSVMSEIAKIRAPKVRKAYRLLLEALKNNPEWEGTSAEKVKSI